MNEDPAATRRRSLSRRRTECSQHDDVVSLARAVFSLVQERRTMSASGALILHTDG